MKPDLRLDGGSLVLHDAYTATTPIRVGDSLKVSGENQVAPTQAASDQSIGIAFASANVGETVPVILLGLARSVSMENLDRGDAVAPSAQSGRARRADPTQDLLTGRGKAYGVAIESKAAGRPVWLHLL